MLVTRFAPSPTGYLHLGHALSALVGWRTARGAQGRFLLRIEDIDPERCHREYEAAIYEDLAWLGIGWERPARRQSEHMADYAAALLKLRQARMVYPCFCSRQDVARERDRNGGVERGGVERGGAEMSPLYPGTCRRLASEAAETLIRAGRRPAWRLDMARACASVGVLSWHDRHAGRIVARPERFGDLAVARKDVPTSYHLSVVVDDHLQGITLVTRGHDLFDATHIHRLLQALLGYATPTYLHHRLLLDETGAKLSKRDGALGVRVLREQGRTPEEVWAMAGVEG